MDQYCHSMDQLVDAMQDPDTDVVTVEGEGGIKTFNDLIKKSAGAHAFKVNIADHAELMTMLDVEERQLRYGKNGGIFIASLGGAEVTAIKIVVLTFSTGGVIKGSKGGNDTGLACLYAVTNVIRMLRGYGPVPFEHCHLSTCTTKHGATVYRKLAKMKSATFRAPCEAKLTEEQRETLKEQEKGPWTKGYTYKLTERQRETLKEQENGSWYKLTEGQRETLQEQEKGPWAKPTEVQREYMSKKRKERPLGLKQKAAKKCRNCNSTSHVRSTRGKCPNYQPNPKK
jgi:hypothetical protein